MPRARWEVENSFRDFTQAIRLEQWHSKFINGIRQELLAVIANLATTISQFEFGTSTVILRKSSKNFPDEIHHSVRKNNMNWM